MTREEAMAENARLREFAEGVAEGVILEGGDFSANDDEIAYLRGKIDDMIADARRALYPAPSPVKP